MSDGARQDRRARVDPALMEVLKDVRQALVRRIGERFQMVLFGSQARGEARPDSDVDLMIILPDDLATHRTKDQVRDVVYGFSLSTPYLLTLLIVSESLARERSGFLAFGAAEREGVTV